jgi:hypothetical protein
VRVIIASLMKQHAYAPALAAQECGFFERFITSMYHKPKEFRYRLLERAIRSQHHNGDLARIHARRAEGLADERVVSIPWPEVTEQIWRRSRLLSQGVHPDSVTYLKNEVFDWMVAQRYLGPCEVFHGFKAGQSYCEITARQCIGESR